MLEVDTRPVPGRRRRSMPAEAPSCSAYDSIMLPETQNFLQRSVTSRTDFEWARYLTGYVVEDEAKEIASGRWTPTGFCEIPTSEVSSSMVCSTVRCCIDADGKVCTQDYAVEILFAPSGDAEVVTPTVDQVSATEDDGGVMIKAIQGLRFGMTRAWPGGDAFMVTQVGPYRVPVGAMVSVSDPVVCYSPVHLVRVY